MTIKAKLKKGIVACVLATAAIGFYIYLVPRAGVMVTDNAYVHGEISLISAEVAGIVTQVYVNDNQPVQAGDLLAELDKRDFLARRDQAQSSLAMAEASIANADQRIEVQKVNIDEVATVITAAQADANFQYREWQRFAELLRKNMISSSSHDAQHNRMKQSRAALKAAKLKLTAAEQQLTTLLTEREKLVAQRDVAKASLELAVLDLEDTEIRAPISGVIGNRAIRTGRYVNKGNPLLAIVPVDDIWIEANYKENQITNIRSGQKVEIKLDSFPDHHLEGKVLSAAPATGAQFSLLPPDNATGNFVKIVQRVPVKISIQLPDGLRGRVVPGLSAEVEIDTNS